MGNVWQRHSFVSESHPNRSMSTSPVQAAQAVSDPSSSMHVSEAEQPRPRCSPIEGLNPTQHRVGMGRCVGPPPSSAKILEQLNGFGMSQLNVSARRCRVFSTSFMKFPLLQPPTQKPLKNSTTFSNAYSIVMIVSLMKHTSGFRALSKTSRRNSHTLTTMSRMNLPSCPVSMIILYMRSPMILKNSRNSASTMARVAMTLLMIGPGSGAEMRPTRSMPICMLKNTIFTSL